MQATSSLSRALHFLLLTGWTAASPFSTTSFPALANAMSSSCAAVYNPTTSRIGYHSDVVLKRLGSTFRPPSPQDFLQSSFPNLLRAMSMFGEPSSSFASMEEFIAFLSNLMWESLCFTEKEELECKLHPSTCRERYGGAPGYWGRGYIQLTYKSNYESFSKAINRPDIMTDPGLVARDETLAWASAIFFWRNTCKRNGQTGNVGIALMCINNPECHASDSQSKVYSQVAPYYRSYFASALTKSVGAEDTTLASKQACKQMTLSLDQGWIDYCRFHAITDSPVCASGFKLPNVDLPSSPVSTGTSAISPSPATTIVGTVPLQSTSLPSLASSTSKKAMAFPTFALVDTFPTTPLPTPTNGLPVVQRNSSFSGNAWTTSPPMVPNLLSGSLPAPQITMSLWRFIAQLLAIIFHQVFL